MADQMNPDKNSPFYYDRDLANEKLTWRLYEVGKEAEGAILRGFYSSGKEFGVTHEYSKGMGDSLGTSIRVGMRDALRSMASKSRDLYNHRDNINDFKNSAINLIDDGNGKRVAVDALGASLVGSIGSIGGGIGAGIGAGAGVIAGEILQKQDWFNEAYSEAIGSVRDFDIGKEWNNLLKTSQAVTQGDKSKIFSNTTISIPSISGLKTRVWTTKDVKVTDFINEILYKYFIGTFERLEGGGGGYWNAPNGLDIVQDDATTTDDVKGAFTLFAGRYQIKNVLIKDISWDYSREFARLDEGESLEVPAYVDITINLDLYKYPTPEYLKSITG